MTNRDVLKMFGAFTAVVVLVTCAIISVVAFVF